MSEEEIIDIIEEILQDPFVYFSQDSSYESVQIRANAIQELLKKYKQQQKEIEELKKENFDTVYIQAIADYKSKIKEMLGIIEPGTDIETYLKDLVDENNRLEDIEDRKVQVAVDNIEKQRDKYWRDKIRELINKRNAGIGYTSLECIEDIEKLLEE